MGQLQDFAGSARRSARNISDSFVCFTWNIRGLTDLKLFELIMHMKQYDIDILCIQETHRNDTCIYEELGFVIILSGTGEDVRTWSGVGFIVAPWCKHKVKSYKQISERMCSLRMKVRGGILAIFPVYAPHNLKPLPDRLQFFTQLDVEYRKCSANLAKLVLGDFNSRLGLQRPGEEQIIGDHTFGRPAIHEVEVPNRDLLLEFCQGCSLVVANTFETPIEEKVTFKEAGATFWAQSQQLGTTCLTYFFEMMLLWARY